jgi:hypothetical protein
VRIDIGDIVEIDSFNPKRSRSAVVLELPRKRPHVGYTILVLLEGEIVEVLRDAVSKKEVLSNNEKS